MIKVSPEEKLCNTIESNLSQLEHSPTNSKLATVNSLISQLGEAIQRGSKFEYLEAHTKFEERVKTVIEVYEKQKSSGSPSVSNQPVEKKEVPPPKTERFANLHYGAINQFENKQPTESCPSNVAAFLSYSLNHGTEGIDPATVTKIIQLGIQRFKGLVKEAMLFKQEIGSVSGLGEELQGTRINAHSALAAYEDGIGSLPKSPNSVVLESRGHGKAVIAGLGKQLIKQADKNPLKKAGAMITINGKTFGLTVELGKERPIFTFFDSHGVKASQNKGYVVRTNDLDVLVGFFEKNVLEFKDPYSGSEYEKMKKHLELDGYKGENLTKTLQKLFTPPKDQNEMSFVLVNPKTEAVPFSLDVKETAPISSPKSELDEDWIVIDNSSNDSIDNEEKKKKDDNCIIC
ncbi:MAG: hypothetical protein KDK60_03910 [Chlamydiia bacterium]|nr:hypothetical protein [Chlamydiia bacterium]